MINEFRAAFISALVVLFLWGSQCLGEISASIYLDHSKIYRNSSASGFVELVPDSTLILKGGHLGYFGWRWASLIIFIYAPDGTNFTIDREYIRDGLHGNYGSGADFTWPEGQSIVLPFQILRSREGFVFDTEGSYSIEFWYPNLPGEVMTSSKVEVTSCHDCGEEEFIERVGEWEVLMAFSRDFGLADPGVPGLYGEEWARLIPYQAGGGAMRSLFWFEVESLNLDFFSMPRIGRGIELGLEYSSLLGVNDNLWGYLAGKHEALTAGMDFPNEPLLDDEGRWILIPSH